jgi:hypothetical protein
MTCHDQHARESLPSTSPRMPTRQCICVSWWQRVQQSRQRRRQGCTDGARRRKRRHRRFQLPHRRRHRVPACSM